MSTVVLKTINSQRGDRTELSMLPERRTSNTGCSSGCPTCTCVSAPGARPAPANHTDTAAGALGERERHLRRPFILKFRTANLPYVYDVNTNKIVQVSATVFDIIDDFGVLNADEMVVKYSAHHTAAEVREAYREVETANRGQGLFSNNRPTEILYPLDEPSLRLLYDENLPIVCLGVTEQCNLRCTYCGFSGAYRYSRTHNDTWMSFDVARAILDFHKKHSMLADHVNISFYGGEPLLNARLIRQCVDYAKQLYGRKPVHFHMTTNGTLLNEENCRLLVENDFALMVSVDGPREIHDRYRVNRGSRGSFDRIARNLRRLREMDPGFYRCNVRLNMVLAPPYDFGALDEFVSHDPIAQVGAVKACFVVAEDTTFFDRFAEEELTQKPGLEELAEKYEHAVVEGRLDEGVLPQELKLAAALDGKGLENLVVRMAPTPSLPAVYHPGGICAPGLKKLFVTPEGKFFICEKCSTTSDLLCLGTVEEGLDAAKGMRNIESYTHPYDGCRCCYAIRHCGTCFIRAYADGRFDHGTKLSYCNKWRASFQSQLVSLATVLEQNPAAFAFMRNVELVA